MTLSASLILRPTNAIPLPNKQIADNIKNNIKINIKDTATIPTIPRVIYLKKFLIFMNNIHCIKLSQSKNITQYVVNNKWVVFPICDFIIMN